MPGMTSRPKSRVPSRQAACVAAGVALGLAVGANAFAASPGAVARASATVVEPASVNRFLGAPVTVQDLLAAWHASGAGPQTGGAPLRLPSLLPVLTAAEQELALVEDLRLDESAAWSDAHGSRFGAALLQAGLAAAVSATSAEGDEGHGALLFITVDFN